MAAPTSTPGARLGAAPVALVFCGIGSVQLGAAVAATLFDDLGPVGTVWLRLAFAAAVLVALWRPSVRGTPRADLRLVLVFGLVLGAMNVSFYEALDRVPLGIVVTLEFVGPLGVAIAGSRRGLDLLWVVLAAAGIVALGGGVAGIDAVGAGLSLLAGAFWAAYILLSARLGGAFAGGHGLALAMVVGAAVVTPWGAAQAGDGLLDPRVLALAAVVAVLSSVIPYSLELEALRRMPPRVFGVLMSLEPAAAALAGFVVLGQSLGAVEILAIALVMAASTGAAVTARGSAPVAID